MDWAEPGGEEMYISNSAAFNMRIKVTLFTRPMKGSSETEFSQTMIFPWGQILKDNRLESSTVDLKKPLSQIPVAGVQEIEDEKYFIFANLCHEESLDMNDAREKVELLRVRTDGNRHFWFRPDLSGGRPPYKISSMYAMSGKQWFYKIEGVQVGSEQLENFTMKPCEVNWTQPFPDDGLSGYYIFGEVLESHGFEYPNVSIVITNDSDDQSVVTPSVSPNTDNMRFYSFSFEMDYKIKSDERLPNLIIQCVSFDFWQNRRIEGYGHISMPTETGTHELVIPCWRPKQGLEQDLRRFFLGGSSELISPSASVGFNKNLNKISRLGLHTISTGYVKLRLRILRHTASPVLPKEIEASTDGKAQITLSAVERFYAARQRMLEARGNMPSLYKN